TGVQTCALPILSGPPTALTAMPTPTQRIVPTTTYQVHASGVNAFTAIIRASDVPMPAMTPRSVAVRVSTPIRNAPSIGPYTIDAIVRPTVNTDPQPRARIAIAIRITPHAAVSHRESFRRPASFSRRRASG